MVKIINTKNINKYSNLKLKGLSNDEFYVLYTEDSLKTIALIKAKRIDNSEIKINDFVIDPDFKSESIEKIILSNLIYFAKKNKYKKIYTEIDELKDELLNLGFEKNNTVYEKNLSPDIKEDNFVMGIAIFSIFTEVASITTKLTVGILFNSFALIAEAFHVLSDFILSTITYISLKITGRPETIYFPHGHKRMQNLIAFIMGIIILIGGFTLFLNTIGLNKFVHFGGESGIHFHLDDHDHDHKNVLEILSNKSLKKSIWIPLVPFIFLLVKILEYLIKYGIGKKYKNSLLLALASIDKNCIFTHGGIALSLFLATYVWSGFDKIISIFITFIIIREGLHVVVRNARDLLSRQDINKKREIKEILINIGITNLKELEFLQEGSSNTVLYVKLDLKAENSLESLEEKIDTIKNTIKNKYKEINKIHILI